ncbi:MAG TPA: MFS transporter [Acidimicrobiales bacterium]|nr:MFS transporter [Acidimicrobiales bacterium]
MATEGAPQPIKAVDLRDQPAERRKSPVSWMWDRKLDHYPHTAARFTYLAIVVLAAIVLYYEFYVQAAVTPSILVHFHMTFPFFVYVLVVGNLVGAFASLLAGLADRWGRANMVVYGLLVTGLITLLALPYAPNLWAYAVFYSLLGFVEGIILVATPALIRDFSPQLGRASAMAFWTLGPVVASLTVSLVSSHTLNHLHAWEDQFIICGIVGLVAFVVAFVGLRELSPGIRDQLMVSVKDRVLVEARAAGIDIEESLKHPWRQMLDIHTVIPSAGIGVFLIVYYTMIAFLVTFMVLIFGYSQLRGNLLGNWAWAFNAGALVLIGIVSDKTEVRKPYMVLGALIAMAGTALLAVHTTQANTGYYTFVWIFSLLAVGLGFAFSPWLAAYTETVEDRNPALAATGLAIWGWILRIVVAGSLFILPFVVTSMTPIVEHGAQVQAIAARYPTQVATLSAIDPATRAALNANPGNVAAIGRAVTEISRAERVTPAVALGRLVGLTTVPRADLAYLNAYGTQVQKAVAVAPQEWQRWWWVCFGTEALLLPTVFLLRGRWDPRAARRDAARHEAEIQTELAELVHH